VHPLDAWIIRRVSDDALTLAQRAVDAFNEQGADPAAAKPTPPGIYSSEPEIVPIRAALEGITYSGPTALADFWRANRESWARLHLDLERLEPVGAGILGVGTLTATSRDTGAEVRSRIAVAVHVRDGRIWRNAVHLTEEGARRDLGAD
jgi:hypothetical protein